MTTTTHFHVDLPETLDRIADAFLSLDDTWRLVYLNAAAASLLRKLNGTDPRDAMGKPLWDVIPSLVGTPFEAAYRDAMATQRPQHVEAYFEPATAWMDVFIYPSSTGLSVFARDVTTRRRAQDAVTLLAEAGARMAAATDYEGTLGTIAEIAVPSFADYCVIDLAEHETFRRVALAHRSSSGRAVLEGALPYAPTAEHPLAETWRTGAPFLIEHVSDGDITRLARSDEHARVMRTVGLHSLLSVPLVARGRALGVMTFARTRESNRVYEPADIELAAELGRRAGSALEKARLQMEAQHAVRARDDVLGVVAHDLRNPIHTISMSASVLEELALNEEERRAQIAIIKRSTERANRLIADLLDVTKIEAGQLALRRTSVDVNGLLKEVCDGFALLVGKRRLTIDCHVSEDLPSIDADRDRVMQIFSNLLGNAIKFTPDGGGVHVDARQRGTCIEFSVTDTGRGIKDADLPHVFDRFWQATRGKDGAGLGLAIVRGIVHAHGGSVAVESTLGAGTTFRFTLPIARGAG